MKEIDKSHRSWKDHIYSSWIRNNVGFCLDFTLLTVLTILYNLWMFNVSKNTKMTKF